MSAYRLPLLNAYWLLSLVLSLLVASSSSLAQPTALDAAELQQQPMQLTPYLGLLEDKQGQLSLADVLSAPVAQRFTPQGNVNSIALGFTHSAYWLRIPLRNSQSLALEPLLVLANPRIAHVELYVPTAQGQYDRIVTGSDLPSTTRPYANRYFVFPLTLAAHSDSVLYMRVQSNIGVLLPLQLWSAPSYSEAEHSYTVAQAWYFGMACAMILFNLLLAIALRERIYLLYVLFASSTTYTFAIKNGLAPDLLWSGVQLNTNVAYFSGVSIAIASMLWFMRRMLHSAVLLPRVDRCLRATVWLYGLSLLLYAYSLETFARVGIVLNLATALLILAVACTCAWKRQRGAYYFLAAFTLLMLGGVITALRAMGLLPNNVITADGIQFASGCEMLLLAFALADRIYVIRRDKAQVQGQLLNAQQLLVSTLQDSERELERRVAERTAALNLSNAKLEAMSLTDALTGIANRRHFDQVLAQEWSRAQRLQTPLALSVIDVDWFKQFNDLFGHPSGDSCLRQIAETLAQTCRASDLVARYGGEEFVILAPMTDRDGAKAMAEKVLQAVAALNLPHPYCPTGRVSVSLGFAVAQPSANITSEHLLQLADQALYQAKQQGRNQFVGAPLCQSASDVPQA
jgi:diguanylate cyclase (GGDEF)-like protein